MSGQEGKWGVAGKIKDPGLLECLYRDLTPGFLMERDWVGRKDGTRIATE